MAWDFMQASAGDLTMGVEIHLLLGDIAEKKHLVLGAYRNGICTVLGIIKSPEAD